MANAYELERAQRLQRNKEVMKEMFDNVETDLLVRCAALAILCAVKVDFDQDGANLHSRCAMPLRASLILSCDTKCFIQAIMMQMAPGACLLDSPP